MKHILPTSPWQWGLVLSFGLYLSLPQVVMGDAFHQSILANAVVTTHISSPVLGNFTRHTIRLEWTPSRYLYISKRVWENGEVNFTLEYRGLFREKFVLMADDERWVFSRSSPEIFAHSHPEHQEGRFVRTTGGGIVRLTTQQFNRILESDTFTFHGIVHNDDPKQVNTLTNQEWAVMKVWLRELVDYNSRV